ncbi:MFS transporter [Microlunatus soli]|uniref:MFS transporter n=1 Tax=Microlunatus soli TaxID=630515 RepID=UPI0012F7D26D|nr:MFS transporter [Microlunatus soli]
MSTTDLDASRRSQAGRHGEPSQPPHSDQPDLTASGLAGLLLGGLLSTYTFGSINDALPVIGRDLGASGAELSLLLGGFACGFAAVLIIAGRLGDRFGRRTVFRIGIVAFAVASAAAGFSTGIETLIALRVVQGLAAGAFMPQVLSTIQATTTGAARVRAVSAYAAVLGCGTGVGQVLAGALIGLDLGGTGWRPVLWSGVLLAGVALLATVRVPQTRSATPSSADLPGAIMMALSIAALVYALSIGPSAAWPPWSMIMIGGAVVLAVIFYRHERRTERSGRIPLAPPSILRLPALRLGLIMAGVFFIGYGGLMNVFALMSQSAPGEGGLGLSAMLSGVTVIPFVIAYVIASMLVGRLMTALGSVIMIVGALAQIVGLVAMAITGYLLAGADADRLTVAVAIQIPFMITGAAQAIMFGPMMQTVMVEVPVSAAGLSGGLISTVQQTAFGLGVAILGGVYRWIAASSGALIGFATGVITDAVAAVCFVVLAFRLRRLRSPRDQEGPSTTVRMDGPT